MRPNPKTPLALLLLATLAVGFSALVACRESTPPPREPPESRESLAQPTDRGEALLTIGAETQQRASLQTASLQPTNLPREITTFGRVLDPAPLLAQASEILAAEVASRLSRQEWERLLQLRENTSARALQTAEANARRDAIALQAATTRLRLEWGSTIAATDSLSNLVQSLAAAERQLVRLDLPAGGLLTTPPAAAQVIPLGTATPIPARFLGIAPTVNTQNQAQGVFLLAAPAAGLLPGASITGSLTLPGEPSPGVVVPASAILRHNGKAWVYQQLDATRFARREVILETPLSNGWFVSRGLQPADRLVVSGAQILLSEETKSQFRLAE